MQQNVKTYAGVFAAPVCPMNDDQSIDEPGLERYLRWILSRSDIRGLVVNVNAGEGTFLENEDRNRVIADARRVVPRNVKLVAGVCGNSTRDMIKQTQMAEASGADAVIVIPVREWQNSRGPGQAETLYNRLGSATSLPLIVFNSVSAQFDTDTLIRILDVPTIVAVKQAVTDIGLYQDQFRAIRRARPDVSILSANDAALLPTLAIGADGVLLGIAGFLPDLVIGLFNAARDGDYEAARKFADELAPMSHYLYGVPPRSLRHVRTKAALKRLGIIASEMVREPLLPLDDAERRKLEQAMRSAGLLESTSILASAA
ncbi:MAG: dihydrodipicolinate synthetase [Betaproteobacteria bacterium]|jgi:4-hydroxy-tetrahydrodipicolinate synthase|nr:dihydrodipicolinate synthetase [Betaproteobacteria bacterium]